MFQLGVQQRTKCYQQEEGTDHIPFEANSHCLFSVPGTAKSCVWAAWHHCPSVNKQSVPAVRIWQVWSKQARLTETSFKNPAAKHILHTTSTEMLRNLSKAHRVANLLLISVPAVTWLVQSLSRHPSSWKPLSKHNPKSCIPYCWICFVISEISLGKAKWKMMNDAILQ